MLTAYYTDPHPDNRSRCEMVIKKLEYELANNKKDLSTEQIKEIEEDIRKVKAVIDGAPLYKKWVDRAFAKYFKERDKIGSDRHTDEEIFELDSVDANVEKK